MPNRRARPLGVAWIILTLAATGCGPGPGAPESAPQVRELVIVTATPGPPPLPTAPTGAVRRYVVREGDTLSAIAARFDVSEAALLRANDLEDPNLLAIGQELVIPPPEP